LDLINTYKHAIHVGQTLTRGTPIELGHTRLELGRRKLEAVNDLAVRSCLELGGEYSREPNVESFLRLGWSSEPGVVRVVDCAVFSEQREAIRVGAPMRMKQVHHPLDELEMKKLTIAAHAPPYR
jgi:hypothetical protein